MFKCRKCGNMLRDGARFCDNCGVEAPWTSKEDILKIIDWNRNAIELDIDPYAVWLLYSKSSGAIVVLFFAGFLGPLLAPFIWHQRRVIEGWLMQLADENYSKKKIPMKRIMKSIDEMEDYGKLNSVIAWGIIGASVLCPFWIQSDFDNSESVQVIVILLIVGALGILLLISSKVLVWNARLIKESRKHKYLYRPGEPYIERYLMEDDSEE